MSNDSGKEVKRFVCICCPIGCALEATRTAEGVTVIGNTCKRGENYGIAEMTEPTRTVTSTVAVSGGSLTRVPVKTAAPIPKPRIFDALAEIKQKTVAAPVAIGDVIVKNVAGTGIDVVATRNIEVRADG